MKPPPTYTLESSIFFSQERLAKKIITTNSLQFRANTIQEKKAGVFEMRMCQCATQPSLLGTLHVVSSYKSLTGKNFQNEAGNEMDWVCITYKTVLGYWACDFVTYMQTQSISEILIQCHVGSPWANVPKRLFSYKQLIISPYLD